MEKTDVELLRLKNSMLEQQKKVLRTALMNASREIASAGTGAAKTEDLVDVYARLLNQALESTNEDA